MRRKKITEHRMKQIIQEYAVKKVIKDNLVEERENAMYPTLAEYIEEVRTFFDTYDEAVSFLYERYKESYTLMEEMVGVIELKLGKEYSITPICARERFPGTKIGFNQLKIAYMYHNDEFIELENQIISEIGEEEYERLSTVVCANKANRKLKYFMDILDKASSDGLDDEEVDDDAEYYSETPDYAKKMS